MRRSDRSRAVTRLVERFPLVNEHPDVAGVLRDAELLSILGPALAEPFRRTGVTAVCAPEARGPILGALVAVELGAGLVLVRKDERNHPGADRRVESAPTWRGTSELFQSRSWDLGPDDVHLQIEAAGVNFADLIMRMGLYGTVPPRPFSPGFEIAGTVARVGSEVEGW
ncbi:MAG: alcohol dehydrogenase catalytic domain-containing protein, partial [Ilumatobacteraceae bacterium]